LKVLLLSMPDSFEHMPTVAIRMPNGALTSLAGNVDSHHRVAVADLVLVQDRVRETVERLVREFAPDVVGLSIMTFQRRTAARIVQLVRELKPDVRVVVGGYDPSLAPEAYMADGECSAGECAVSDVDFIVRGEGEVTFRELLRAVERGYGFETIAGLTWRRTAATRSDIAGEEDLVPVRSVVVGCGTGHSPVPTQNTLRRTPPFAALRMVYPASENPAPDPAPGGLPSERTVNSAYASEWVVNPERPVHSLEDGEVRLPNRGARVIGGYTMMGRQVDVVETSRGCTYDCSFCSIIEMRGRNFHTYTFDRVVADIRDAREHGARVIFLVDDNITLNVRRFEALCRAIVDAGLNDLDYIVQGMTSAIASHGETLAPLMRRAGFRYVFLGIENILPGDLTFLKAAAKNAEREEGRTVGNATLKAIGYLHRNKMLVVGGLIVGNPDDTRESIEANLRFARKYVDWPYIQHPTPYPRTPMTRDFLARNLIVNDRLHEYDGTTAVVKTECLAAEEIEFMRWRAERWMKVRHMPAVFRHDPWFVMTHWPRMLAHTFRGSTWRSVLGLESQRKVFERYKRLRQKEREHVCWMTADE
jgi:anaerobic magnesium-protoporphyrin IX monomethyl ester cyclase